MRVPAAVDQAWAGIDVGKKDHWVCVVDQDGRQLLSVKVANDQAEIEAAIGSVTGLGKTITWAVDMIGAPSALLLAVLSQAGQHVRYASGRLVAAMSGAYAGEGKTDPKDAYVIAETARIRRTCRSSTTRVTWSATWACSPPTGRT
jgi:Transposase